MLVRRRLTLQIGVPADFTRVYVSQYDTAWEFLFEVLYNGQPFEVNSDYHAALNCKKQDGNTCAYVAEVHPDNTWSCTPDIQLTAVDGPVECTLSIISAGGVVSTANFIVVVEKAPVARGDISSETTLPAYAEILDRIAEMEGGGGGSVTVDSELSDTSTNPVQNKVIAAALANVGSGAATLSPRVYVNASTAAGGDGTESAPYNDIMQAVNLLNNKYQEIRIYIVASGTYTITNGIFTGIGMHIVATVPGVVVAWQDNLPFYQCHLNFSAQDGGTLTFANSWYGDGCSCAFENVIFDAEISMYGGYIRSNGVSYRSAVLYGVSGILADTTITNTDPTVSPLRISRGSDLAFTGTLNCASLTAASQDKAMITAYYCTLRMLTNVATAITNKYNRYIEAYSCTIIGSKDRLDDNYGNVATTANLYNGTLIVNGRANLPADIQSLPAGGTAGQFLVKQSATDYDAAWTTMPNANGVSF